ncbi:hypothetical protein HNQ82_001893 [Anoxybacillus tengchongensis]|uniref:Uncharacterized protein n=1 Tax=Anoxybacillus tengchongensis TaxID=576944 RepID=A0A7X0D9T2_9BACL|nr:hypothetical protein [Anoxybacillus tengchongensis]MBB6177062.1 hypothetical protein [Anoxybacillus tengchongensis]
MIVEELDVVRLRDGTEATVLEIFSTEPKYFCQRADDFDDMFYVTTDEITYKCRKRSIMPHF